MSILILLLASLFTVALSQNSKQFQCYHGESTHPSKLSLRNCPSKVCIMYESPCGNYWATTCYKEEKPNEIYAAFKKVQLTNEWVGTYLLNCYKSKCNKKPLKLDYAICSSPPSYDNLIWSQFETGKRSGILESDLALTDYHFDPKQNPKAMKKKITLQILGQTFKKSKNIWIKMVPWILDLDANSNELYPLQLTFNLIKSTVIRKLGSAYSTYKLKQKLIPGQNINITLTYRDVMEQENIVLWVNGEKTNCFPKNYPFGYDAKYGGMWRILNKSQPTRFSFILPKTKDTKIQCNASEDTQAWISSSGIKQQVYPRLNYTRILRNDFEKPYYLIDNSTILKPNEVMDFEFRNTLCPGGHLATIQFQAYQKNSQIYYNIYVLQQYALSRVSKDQKCLDVSLTVIDNEHHGVLEIFCRKKADQKRSQKFLNSVGTYALGPSLYVVRGVKRTFKC